MFIEPMFATPLPNLVKNPKAKPFILEPGRYVSQEKFDGLRIITEIGSNPDQLFVSKGISAWSRYGNLRPHPEHIQEELAKFPNVILDGEICAPGLRSYGTMDLDNTADLVYFVFDILQLEGEDMTDVTYEQRRKLLEQLFKAEGKSVVLAPTTDVNTWDEVFALRDSVWARDGEGLILKRKDAIYTPGKRPKGVWVKIKKLQSALFTITGFIPSRGLINDRGPYAITCLVDDEGNRTQVTTKNDAQCRAFEELAKMPGQHAAIGRKLWCEYQERTMPENSYRHIRWERWDKE